MSPRDMKHAAELLLTTDGEQVARDMGGHLGDQVHELLKRNGMLMRTTGGTVAMGVIAAAQVLSEAIASGARSMDGDKADERLIEAGAAELFLEMLTPRVRAHLRRTGWLSRTIRKADR